MAHLRGHQEIYGGAEGLRHHLCLSHDEHREAGTPVQDLEDLHEEEHDYHPQHRGEYGCAEHTAEDEPGEFDDIHEQIGDIHRGIGVDLPDELHRFVHDRRRRPEDRAQALLDHVSGHENHLGTHWTTEPHVAEDFGEKSAEGYATDRRPGTSVVLHANPPSLDDIDRDPHRWGNGDVYGYSEHGEREVPIRNPDGLDLKGISWAKVHSDWDTPGDREYQHHDFGHEPKTAELLGHFETAAEPEHETWYHLTDNPHFALDPEHEPADNAFAMDDRSGRKGIYLGRDPGHWFSAAGEGYARPYLAEVHAHPGISEHDAGGRWGGEIFVPSEHYDKLHLHRVIPIDAHVREHYGDHGWIEGHHGTEFDTGEPLRRNPNNRHYPFSPAWNEPSAYQYPGPDVRDMTPEQHDAHRDRWLDYLKRDRGFDDEDIDYYRQQHDSHRTASRPGRDQKSCPCCGGIGSHGDQCHACNGSGFVGRNETVEHCPGQPQPKRRHWRQGSMPQPDYDTSSDMPVGRGVFYRAHVKGQPLDEAHAASRALYPDKSQKEIPRRGYSAFADPRHLSQYMDEYGWTGSMMHDREVVAFHGEQVGRGEDHEPLVVPRAAPGCCGRIVHSTSPWNDFEKKVWGWDGEESPLEHRRLGPKPWDNRRDPDPVQKSIDRHQRRHAAGRNVTASADDGGMTANPWDSIRMASPAEYGKYSYPDYPRARTPATLARYFRQHEPDYYEQVRRSVEAHGVQEPVLLRYRDPRGTPLKRPVVMSGHHRAAAAWEAGRDMPVGDYDNQEHYDASTTDFGQKWWQDHHELKEAAGDPRRKEATVQAEAAADDSEWGYEAYTPPAERRESVRHILDHYLPSDGSTWDDVRDNMDFSVAGDSRRVLDDVRRSGEVRRPIPIDYGQTPPRVMNGHTRLISADMAGVADVPTRQHHGFMDPDDPDEHGNQPYHRGHWTNQPEWQESLRSEGSFKDPAASGDETSNDYKDELLGHFEAAGDYRSSHTAPHPDAGHLPLHHYQNGSPEDPVRIYRSAPPGTEAINHGDWVSLSADYAHQHGRHATDSSKDWPVYTAEVPSKHVYWDENDDNEHGYAGPDINHPDVHDEETGTVRSWEEHHEEHPHIGEGWLGGAVHLSPSEHEEAHDEFGSEDDRANILMSAARAQGALSGARWHDDLYPAREDAEHHAGQQREIPEGHHLTAFTVHRNDAGGIEDIGIHHYQHDHPETEWRRYQNIDLEGWHYRHPAIAEAGLGRREAAAEEAAPDEPDYGQWPEVLRQLRYRKRNEPEMHRGMAIDMPQDLHDFVMDSQQTPDRQARAIADHLRTRGLGMHWSVNPKISRDFSAMERRKQPGTARVIVHARLPELEHIETDPDALHEESVFRHDNWLVGEKEIPLKPGAPVHVTGITWYGVNGNRKRRGNVYGQEHIAVALPAASEEPAVDEHPVHRGIGIALSPEDEAVVGDESLPVEHRARHLLDAVTREGHEPLGQHWTTDRGTAESVVMSRGNPAWHVVFHAARPEPHEIITDPGWREEHEVNDSEDEVPVHPRTEMELTGISWKPRGGQWTRHTLEEPEYHRAGTSDTSRTGSSGGELLGHFEAAAEPEPAVPSFTWRYETQTSTGYEPREQVVHGPFYHGGRANLGPGGEIKPGRKPNSWGDEFDERGRSIHAYFSTNQDTAASYARELGGRGHLYEVEPTGEVTWDSRGGDGAWRSKHPLRVIRKVPREEWTGQATAALEHGDEIFVEAAAEPEYGPKPEHDWASHGQMADDDPRRHEEWERWRQEDRDWNSHIRRGLSLGHIDHDTARGLGYYGNGHERQEPTAQRWRDAETAAGREPREFSGWQRLPQEMYHVTTDMPAVRANGLKSREELGQVSGHGLGGGEDDTISLTTDRELAHHMLRAMHEYHGALNDPHSPAKLWEQAKAGTGAAKPFHGEMARYYHTDWKEGDPLPRTLDAAIRGKKMETGGLLYTREEMAEREGAVWEPHRDTGHIRTKDGRDLYNVWERDATPDEALHQRSDLYKHYSYWRAHAGGPPDPLFISNDVKSFAARDPRHFGLLHVRPAPGGSGYPLGGMSEWRTTTGDALDVHHAERLEDGHIREASLHKEAAMTNPHTGGDEWFHGTQGLPEDFSQHGFSEPGGYSHEEAEINDHLPHWNSFIGPHFAAAHDVAEKFAQAGASGERHDENDYEHFDDPWRESVPMSVVHARLHLHNPKVYASEHDMDHEAYEHEYGERKNYISKHFDSGYEGEEPGKDEDDGGLEEPGGDGYDEWALAARFRHDDKRPIARDKMAPTQGWASRQPGHPLRTEWLNSHPDKEGIARRFRERLQAQGHDGIIYGNEYEHSSEHGHSADLSAVAFHPRQVEIEQMHGEHRPCLSHEEAREWRARMPGHGQEELPFGEHQGALDVVAHFEALGAGPYFQQKLFHQQPDPTLHGEDSMRHNPEDPEAGLRWRAEHDENYEPDTCEHCGGDLRRPRQHDEEHQEWLGQQDWYTDWDHEGPGDTIHRGIGADLPDHVHAIVHDSSRPVHERAHALMSHLLSHENLGGSGVGNFWSGDPDVSKTYAESYHHRFGQHNELTPVMFHAHTPDREHFETDPDTLQHWGVYSYHLAGNREVPVSHGAPLRIKGISWAPPGHREEVKSQHTPNWDGPGTHHLDQDPAWQHHEIGGEGIRATASGALQDGPREHAAAAESASDIVAHFAALEATGMNGDRYVICDQGHQHWGAYGAAGLLIRHRGDDGQYRYLLQHRSPEVHEGGTWSTPGGALGRGESPEAGARREAEEEFGELPEGLTHHHTFTDDHGGGWAYHTVIMDTPHRFTPSGGDEDSDWESEGHGWFTPHEMGGLDLHPGFAASWGRVQKSGALEVTAVTRNHWDMTEPQMRLHLRDEHGIADPAGDPAETHWNEHSGDTQRHVHPDLEREFVNAMNPDFSPGDAFSVQHVPYVEPPRSEADLRQHMRGHGWGAPSWTVGDLLEVHGRIHGEGNDVDHHHDPGHHDPVFGSLDVVAHFGDEDHEALWQHMQEAHGVNPVDATRRPAADFLTGLHQGFHGGQVADRRLIEHEHDSQAGRPAPLRLAPIPADELEERRRAHEEANRPKPEPIDDRQYSLDDVSRHYDWEGFDKHEISHLVRHPERASFTLENVPVHSLRYTDEHGALTPVHSYQDMAGQGEDEQDRLKELERGYYRGDRIPPAVVVRDGEHHIIADGSHRAAVHAEYGWTHMPAFVTERTIRPGEHTAALQAVADYDWETDEGPFEWDEIAQRHPHVYGEGEEGGYDGPQIADAAAELYHDRPSHPYSETTGELNPAYGGEMLFHPRTVDPKRIDYMRAEPGDPRVRRAREGYESQRPERVPPLILVHRHGVFYPADGHHRAGAADQARKPVRAYVAYSPHDEPFAGRDGDPPRRGPFHGAETADREPYPDQHGERRRISYPGFPHAAEKPVPGHHTAMVMGRPADRALPPPARFYDGFFEGVANWSPQDPGEAVELFADLPGFFDAIQEGLLTVAGRLDEAPVDPAMPDALRHMAAIVLNVAEDARLHAARLQETGPEGMWETPKA